MAFAICITAYKPDEHCLFTVCKVVVSGKPAKNQAILAVPGPAPGYKTLPMQMSSTSLGSTPTLETTSLRTGVSIASGGVSFYAPLLALVIAVLAIETMTTSSSLLGTVFPALKVTYSTEK